MKLFRCLLLCATLAHTSVSAWVLESSEQQVIPGSTRDVQLTCKADYSSGYADNIQEVSRVRVTKDVLGSKIDIVVFRPEKDILTTTEKQAVVTRGVNATGLTFVRITWTVATKNTAGLYGCEVSGYDVMDNFVSLHVTPLRIETNKSELDEMKKYVKVLIDAVNARQTALSSEIGRLESTVREQRMMIQKQDKEIVKLRSVLMTFNLSVDSNFVTKDELAMRISSLKKTTMAEIITCKQISQTKVDELLHTVHNMSEECKANYTRLQSHFWNIKDQFITRFDKLESREKHSYMGLNSRIQNLSNAVETIETEYRNLKKDMKTMSRQCNSCDIRTTQQPTQLLTTEMLTQDTVTKQYNEHTTTSSFVKSTPPPQPVTSTRLDDLWPNGAYALVKPHAGCPTFANLRVLSIQEFFVPREDADLKYVTLPTIHRQSETEGKSLELCVKARPLLHPVSDWPKGSYCIGQYNGRCPNFFDSARGQYWAESDGTKLGYYAFTFCCRSDGKADDPIVLPPDKPFYLYRYQGSCQTVSGMEVSLDSITVTNSRNAHLTLSLTPTTSIHPDAEHGKFLIRLCYYQPSANSLV